MIKYNFWFVIGTQHLYGEKIFKAVAEHGEKIAEHLSTNVGEFGSIEYKTLVKTSEEIYEVLKEANNDDSCIGIITWMHTFSPSKMWIKGLNILNKPVLHLHTQFNKEIPWEEIDMDFMNLNQSAHGDREHGFIFSRMRKQRKVVSGYYEDEKVIKRISNWMRSSIGVWESQKLNVVRFGDNMRYVAVTEGDKVDAEIKFGWSVNGYGLGELANNISNISQNEIREQMDKYRNHYDINTNNLNSIEEQAKIQVAIRKFLDERNAKAFTTTFEDLNGLNQLPGLAVQDLMREGYGFGAEGDWKTAAMLRIVKLMSVGQELGSTFMEDYTYHLEDNNKIVLGAHMLEVCPSISSDKPIIEVHDLGIGGKDAPARLLFDARKGNALQLSLVDMGDRFRLIASECTAIKPLHDMPKLPVARAMWKLKPSFEVATESWLLAGGAHHTVMTYDLDVDVLRDFAEMQDIEFVHINDSTTIEALKNELRWNDLYYKLNR